MRVGKGTIGWAWLYKFWGRQISVGKVKEPVSSMHLS